MNKREQLLADTLGDYRGNDFARLAAGRVRRRRFLRQLGATAIVVCALVVAFAYWPQPAVPGAGVVATVAAPGLEIISDQELLAELKDLPVLIIRDDNRITGVVFVDAHTKL